MKKIRKYFCNNVTNLKYKILFRTVLNNKNNNLLFSQNNVAQLVDIKVHILQQK